MEFRTDKCKVMVFNGSPNGLNFRLYGDTLEIVDSYKYLGTTLTSTYVTNLFRTHFSDIVERSKLKASVIRGHGFHEDGLRISTAIRLYKLIIRPLLEYCAQSLFYTRYNKAAQSTVANDLAKELEHFQTQTLKPLSVVPDPPHPLLYACFAELSRLPVVLKC